MQMSIPSEHFDESFWEQQIQDAVRESDPVLSNLKITRCHYLLSLALRSVLGDEAGANFHSWAVWGSRKAGVTIRQEDLDEARRDGTVVGGIVGCLVGIGLGWSLRTWLGWPIVPGMALFGAFCGAATGRYIIIRSRRLSSRLILQGNRKVLEDIGRQSARFIARFHSQQTSDPAALADFLKELRQGETSTGGQELLRRAFAQYYIAKYGSSVKERQEAAYLANCLAVLHEHIRLEPYIKGSMPWIVRRCVTKRLLQFDIGPVRLAVAKSVPSLDGIPFPESLRSLSNRELVEFLTGPDGWDVRDPDRSGHGAQDWTKIRERMRYIVNLFRALHLDASVWKAPYDPDQLASVAQGRLPTGSL